MRKEKNINWNAGLVVDLPPNSQDQWNKSCMVDSKEKY